MCFAPQWRALFRHLNFQKWSEPGFVHFDFDMCFAPAGEVGVAGDVGEGGAAGEVGEAGDVGESGVNGTAGKDA